MVFLPYVPLTFGSGPFSPPPPLASPPPLSTGASWARNCFLMLRMVGCLIMSGSGALVHVLADILQRAPEEIGVESG
jgi:hypothetical protein